MTFGNYVGAVDPRVIMAAQLGVTPQPAPMGGGLFRSKKPLVRKNGGGAAGISPPDPTTPTASIAVNPPNNGLTMAHKGMPQMMTPQQAVTGAPLGGSMRQPFDYDKAMQALQGEQKKPKWWQYGLAAVGDALVQNSGGQPWATRTLAGQQSENAERLRAAAEQLTKWKHDDWARQNEADLRASAPFTIGRDRVTYDPASGQTNVLYDGPEDFELYAQELGLQPGTEDYYRSVEDYVLRSSGPSAYDRDVSLDDYRTNNDASLERLRAGNRRDLENLRQGNRRGIIDYRNANPTPRRASGPRVDSSLPVVSSPAEARRLPSGTRFRTPDGKVKVVP